MKEIRLMTKEDCVPDVDIKEIDITNKIVILKHDFFKEEYLDARYQLVKCVGGFGAHPHARGNAIFIKWFYDGETNRIERYDDNILGLATEEAIAEWKNIYGVKEEL